VYDGINYGYRATATALGVQFETARGIVRAGLAKVERVSRGEPPTRQPAERTEQPAKRAKRRAVRPNPATRAPTEGSITLESEHVETGTDARLRHLLGEAHRRLLSHPSAIPYDGHLSLALSRMRLANNLTRQLVSLARETDSPMPTRPSAASGDPERLRGLPAIGRSVSGAVRGSDPYRALAGRDREVAILVRDLSDGASPGSQPEEACLAAEAETMRRLEGRLQRGADAVHPIT
jgi:hypothetical protein